MKDVNWWLEIQAGLELASTACAGLGRHTVPDGPPAELVGCGSSWNAGVCVWTIPLSEMRDPFVLCIKKIDQDLNTWVGFKKGLFTRCHKLINIANSRLQHHVARTTGCRRKHSCAFECSHVEAMRERRGPPLAGCCAAGSRPQRKSSCLRLHGGHAKLRAI